MGSTTATITYGAGGANLYNLEWGPCGFTQGTGTFLNGQTGTSQSLTGLAPGTCYDVYIQTDCGVGGASTWEGPLSFTTLCLPAAMPYTQDFTNWPPTCFQLLNGGFDWEHDATNGYAVAEFWFNFTGKATMVTQSVTISQEAQVKFLWAHQFQTFYPDEQLILRAQIVGNTAWDTLSVLAGPSFNSPNAQPTSPPAKTDFIEELVYLDSATYTGQTVVFELIGVTDYGPHCYVDDFTVEAAPACVPATGLTVTGSTATTSNLDWNVSGNGTSNLEWGPQGFTQGTGTAITGLTTSAYTLTGLTGNTCYDYYVQVNCGVAGTSAWAGPFTWCTPCTNDTISYLQDFNAPQVPSCFTVDPVSTGPFSPAWQFDGQYAYAPFWNFSSGTILMNTKQVYIAANAQVSFAWAHQYQTFYPDDQLILLARPIGQATWDTLIDLIGPTFNSPNAAPTTPPGNKNDFITETIRLNPTTYTGQIAEFRFVGVTDFGPNAYIDDFLVEAVPSCPKPTALAAANITQTAADLSWTSNAPGSSWQISYGPPSGTATSGTKVSAPTNPFTLTGLSASTSYCFYVREICGPGDTSSWSNSGCFTMACGAVTLPFSEDFSATTLSSCWSNSNLSGNTSLNALWKNTSTSWPAYAAQGKVDNTGNGGYAMGVDGSSPYPLNDIMLETPELIFTGVPSPELTFSMFSSVAGFGPAADLNELIVEFYDGTNWIDSVFYFQGDSANWFNVTVPLGGYPVSGGNAKIRFKVNKVGTTAFYNDIIIDDIMVASGSACPPPTGVAATNPVCDGFNVNFTSGSGTTQVEYGPTGFTPGTGTVVNPATSPLSISGLTPGTGYEVYVTDLCGGALGTPAGPIAVTTATGPLPVAAFSTGTITVGPTSASVPFDASASTGGPTYTWDFGNTTTGSGVNASGTYTANGTYTVTLVVSNACGTDTLTQQVTVAGIGMAEIALNNSFEVFPNPAKGKVSVAFTLLYANAATVELLDLSGRVIWSESAQVNGTYRKDISLDALAAGVYLVRVNSADGVATKRLIVD